MKPKARVEHRRSKLPPILEIDEDGLPIADYEPWRHTRWSSDEDTPGLQLDDWPGELDD
jgi:hypothetical protein